MKSLNKALEILELVLGYKGHPITPGDAAKHCGTNASSCVRTIKALVARGYLIQVSRRSGYISGPMVFALGDNDCFYSRLTRIAEPVLRRISPVLHHRVILTTAAAGRKFILRQYEDGGCDTLNSVQNDFYQTTSGRLLLAYFPAAELAAYIKVNGLPGSAWKGMTTVGQLQEELAAIGTKRYYRMVDEEGNICIAVPVLVPGQPAAGISSYVRNEEDVETAISVLTGAAAEITAWFRGTAVTAL